MVRFRRYSALLLPVVMLFLLNSCTSHYWATRPVSTAMDTGPEVVMLHWGPEQFELYQPVVKDEILEGFIYANWEMPKKTETTAAGEQDGVRSDPEITGEVGGRAGESGSSVVTHKVHVFLSSAYPLKSSFGPEDPAKVAIPLADINKVEVHEIDAGMTFIKTVGAVALVAGVAFLIVLLTKDSCPFIYVQDGDTFDLVGEIYSGAIHPPLERHDYLPLPVSGEGPCRLKITNEVMEIQHTNLVELLVFDHATTERVLVDRHGAAHRVAELSPPVAAESLARRDVLSLVEAGDDIMFVDGSGTAPETESAMDGMILTFAQPRDARNMNLVVDARNSPWLDHVLGVLFERMGDMFKPWQEAQKEGSPAGMRQWSLDQGLPLKLSVKTPDGWRYVDHIDLAGPIAAREAVVALDLAGLEGDQVTVKLECGYRFWEIDSVLADFSADDSPRATLVSLDQALTEGGEDVTADLLANDDRYFHQPVASDAALLGFTLPELALGLGRSVILHSKGHYDILRSPEGTPEGAFVASFRQPGRVTEYSRELYRTLSGAGGN